MRQNVIFKSMVMSMAILLACVTFSSCSNDDDEVFDIYYSAGFSATNTSGTNVFADMATIKNAFTEAFRTELRVTGNPFLLNGTIDDCNREVKKACQKATESLSGHNFDGTYTYNVTNVNTNKVVFTHTW